MGSVAMSTNPNIPVMSSDKFIQPDLPLIPTGTNIQQSRIPATLGFQTSVTPGQATISQGTVMPVAVPTQLRTQGTVVRSAPKLVSATQVPSETTITPLPKITERTVGLVPVVGMPTSLQSSLPASRLLPQSAPVVTRTVPVGTAIQQTGPSVITDQSLVHHDVAVATSSNTRGTKIPTHTSIAHNDNIVRTSVTPVATRQVMAQVSQPLQSPPVVIDRRQQLKNLSVEVTNMLKAALTNYLLAYRGSENLGTALKMLKYPENLDEVSKLLIKTVDNEINDTIAAFETIHVMGERGLIVSFVYREQIWLVVLPDQVYVKNPQMNATLRKQIIGTFPSSVDIKYHNSSDTLPETFYNRVWMYNPDKAKPFSNYFSISNS